MSDIRQQIEASLAAFGKDDLKAASIGLLKTLGYQSEKTLDLDGTPAAFLAACDKGDLFKDKEKLREHDAKNLIRLLTRLLFVWFVKEKGLIPEPLFQQEELERDWLKDFEATDTGTRYYKAILQNLFFAALNQPVEKREFRKDGRQHRNITNLMRYQAFFRDPKAFVELMKSVVPFMNGGLFECLDKPHPTLKGRQGGDVILYEDGFSYRKRSQAPNPKPSDANPHRQP